MPPTLLAKRQISVHACTIGIPGWEDVMNRKLVDPT
jgi:hypothetical protein